MVAKLGKAGKLETSTDSRHNALILQIPPLPPRIFKKHLKKKLLFRSGYVKVRTLFQKPVVMINVVLKTQAQVFKKL